ncbi:MAG: glycogen synthase GlgA [Thermodesulfobacteriota bacterium]
MGKDLRVLFVASEAVPFAKTGGLADVVGSLPQALMELGVEVKVLMPYYGMVRQSQVPTTCIAENLEASLGSWSHTFDVLAPASGDYPCYFVVRDEFYDRSQLYGTPKGDYFDNLERFAFFSAAVYPFCQALAFKPDLIHCHDWQASLVPVYLRHRWPAGGILGGAKSLLTIHNLAYQGLFYKEKFPLLGLDWSLFSINGLEYYDQINLLKGGIVFADAVNTVSRGYSKEIQTPEFGYGMEGILQSRAEALFGIINGVDYRDWNPETDALLPATFSAGDLKGKEKNKKALMAAFGLSKDLAKAPILGIISRLADQKGFDLVAAVMPELMARKVMVVILGTGEEKYHDWLAEEAPKYPGQLGVKIAFDNKLAHLIEAGADMFLMPSRYEPCGLNQMYSLKYGTIPVVRATGGLADTVKPADPAKGTGTGFLFSDYTPEAFLKALKAALKAYQDKKLWKRLMQNAMNEDFSWKTSAKAYLNLYQRIVSGEV